MADHQGSIIGYTNANGAVTNINTYSMEGVPGDNNVDRFGYTGQMWLEGAELYHYKARAYDPQLGRFLQADPIGYGDGPNMYAYVGGDAMNYRDPTGLTAENEDEEEEEEDKEDEVISTGVRISSGGGGGGSYSVGSFTGVFIGVNNVTDAYIDEIVVTAQKQKKLSNKINFNLPFPDEQLWIVTLDGYILVIPTITEETLNSCGQTVGVNRPAGVRPHSSTIFAVIHTHPKWASYHPAYGDFQTARNHSVYGITPSGSWVIRGGTSNVTRLSGRRPRAPARGGGKTCKKG